MKKASIKEKSVVELTEEEAAVVVQKGRTNINKMFDEGKKIFDEPVISRFHCRSYNSRFVIHYSRFFSKIIMINYNVI